MNSVVGINFLFGDLLNLSTRELRVLKTRAVSTWLSRRAECCCGLHFLACACTTDSPRCDRRVLVNAAAPVSALWPSDISSVYSLPILLLRRHLQVLYGRDIKIGRIYGRKSAARFKAPPARVQRNYSTLLLPATLIYYSRQDRNYHTEMSWSKKSFCSLKSNDDWYFVKISHSLVDSLCGGLKILSN